tara:strand:- start:53 stop:493 length:441 start_codon:yes stop_codon:yes gene_type:complete
MTSTLSLPNQIRLTQNEKAQKKYFPDEQVDKQIKEWIDQANTEIPKISRCLTKKFTFNKQFADEQYYYTTLLSIHKEYRKKFQTWEEAYEEFIWLKDTKEDFDCNSIHLSKNGFQFRQGNILYTTGTHTDIQNGKINKFEYSIVYE